MKKAPRNYSQDLDRRRQGLDAIVGKLNSIPDPTTDDEGKVLKVDDEGNYSLLPDGGSQVMTVAISYDSEQEEYSADKTHAEIIAAIVAGVIVTATYSNRTFVYAGKNQPSAFDAVYFSYLQADSDDQFIGKIFEIDEDDRIVYSEHDLTEGLIPIKAVDTVTLTAGNTSVTISDIAITADSIFDIYTDTFGINPTAANVSSGSLTLTFEEQAADVIVKVVIR